MRYNLPRPGYPATPQQQRDMLQTVGLINNPVLQSVGYNTVSVTQNGIETRDYTPERILGKITGHGTGNIYSFSQVIQTDETGTVAVLDGGVTGTTSNFSAFEMNGRTDVPTNTIVELVPTWGAIQGYGFIYNGVDTSSGTLADAAVHVTATSGGTYTVKRVNRDSGGTLVESSPTVTYTGVYEAQGRTAVVDPTSTPTHELPLFIDKNGKYYFQIDQYATPAYQGLVSITTQTFGGDKVFEQSIEVFSQTGAGTSATRSFIAYADSKAAYSKSFQVSDGVTALSTLSDFGLNFYGVAVGQPAIASFTNGFDSVIDGSLVIGNNFVTTANHYSGGNSWAIQMSGGSTAPNGKDPLSIPTASGGFQLNIPGGAGGANVSPLRSFLFHEYDSVNSTRYCGLAIGSGGADCCIWIYSGGVYKRGYTGLLTFGGGASGDVASLDIFGGVVCGVTLVP